MTVVCLGGSTTFGYTILRDAETYPAVLEQRLWESLPHTRVTVHNAAANKYSSRDSLLMLKRQIPRLKPTHVALYHGVNDMGAIFTYGFRPDHSHRGVPVLVPASHAERFFTRSHLYSTLKYRLGTRPQLYNVFHAAVSVTPEIREKGIRCFRQNILGCRDLASSGGAKLVVATFAYHESTLKKQGMSQDHIGLLEDLNACVRSLAKEPGITVVDPDVVLSDDVANFTDGCHFTADGAAKLAEVIAGGMITTFEQKLTKGTKN
jgi:lysophospholipase L1-like esterase